MAWKDQTKCYRNIAGVRYENWCDLDRGEEQNKEILDQVIASGKKYKLIKHFTGYKQLFVVAD